MDNMEQGKTNVSVDYCHANWHRYFLITRKGLIKVWPLRVITN